MNLQEDFLQMSYRGIYKITDVLRSGCKPAAAKFKSAEVGDWQAPRMASPVG